MEIDERFPNLVGSAKKYMKRKEKRSKSLATLHADCDFIKFLDVSVDTYILAQPLAIAYTSALQSYQFEFSQDDVCIETLITCTSDMIRAHALLSEKMCQVRELEIEKKKELKVLDILRRYATTTASRKRRYNA